LAENSEIEIFLTLKPSETSTFYLHTPAIINFDEITRLEKNPI